MFRVFRIADGLKLEDDSVALGWFVVWAEDRYAAEIVARAHLILNARTVGLLP